MWLKGFFNIELCGFLELPLWPLKTFSIYYILKPNKLSCVLICISSEIHLVYFQINQRFDVYVGVVIHPFLSSTQTSIMHIIRAHWALFGAIFNESYMSVIWKWWIWFLLIFHYILFILAINTSGNGWDFPESNTALSLIIAPITKWLLTVGPRTSRK